MPGWTEGKDKYGHCVERGISLPHGASMNTEYKRRNSQKYFQGSKATKCYHGRKQESLGEKSFAGG